MNRKKREFRKTLIRILALILALMLVGGAIISGLIEVLAESEIATNVHCSALITQADADTYHVRCDITYTNTTGNRLTGVFFSVYANRLRRESALSVEADIIEEAFPMGYAPGGIEFSQVTVNGTPADWGMQGEQELFMRVGCALEPGESCVFGFEYALLLVNSRCDLGYSDDDVRLTGFLPTVCEWKEDAGFVCGEPSSIDRYALGAETDYDVDIQLPDWYRIASPGIINEGISSGGYTAWHISASNIRDFALTLSGKYRTVNRMTSLGTQIVVMGSVRTGTHKAAQAAEEALDVMEEWFGQLPSCGITIVQADMVTDTRAYDGLIMIPSSLFENGYTEELTHRIRVALAQQFFRCDPREEVWLARSLPEFLAYLITEETKGRNAMLKALNEDILSDLIVSMPSRYELTYPITVYTDASDYEVIAVHRGAASFYFICEGMGKENFVSGLAECVKAEDLLDLAKFEASFEKATGRNYDMLIEDWLHNIRDYEGAVIDWFE